jgi:DNA/RNA endonuclease G (NUC1)
MDLTLDPPPPVVQAPEVKQVQRPAKKESQRTIVRPSQQLPEKHCPMQSRKRKLTYAQFQLCFDHK